MVPSKRGGPDNFNRGHPENRSSTSQIWPTSVLETLGRGSLTCTFEVFYSTTRA